jgi:predicted cobalt transporter CbtA
VEQKLVLRGLLAGALAGVVAFLFARIFAEPQIQKAIDYESARDAAQDALNKAAHVPSAEHGSDVFTRSVQANLGLGVGMIAFGAAMGVLFAIAYTVCLGRVGGLRPRTIALVVAAGGFLALYLVPFVKYPANPPSIGHADTIKQRGALYLVMVGAALVLLIGAVALGRTLTDRFGNWTASVLAIGAFVVTVGVVMWLLPSFGDLAFNRANFGHFATETPQPLKDADGHIVFPGFPADVLFDFRLYSVGAQLLLWATLGLLFGPLAERLIAPEMRTAARVART